MSILRSPHNRQNPYAQIARSTLQDHSLSWEAQGMLTYLLSLPNDWKISIKNLITLRNCGEKKVRKIMHELMRAGYCEYEQVRYANGLLGEGNYYIFEERKFKKSLPSGQKGNADSPGAADRHIYRLENIYKKKMCCMSRTREEKQKNQNQNLEIPGQHVMKYHPSGAKLHCIFEEYLQHVMAQKYDFTVTEIQLAWEILERYEEPITDWKGFLDGIIQKIRRRKKWEENEKNRERYKKNMKSSLPESNPSTIPNATSVHHLQKSGNTEELKFVSVCDTTPSKAALEWYKANHHWL